ncbi:hypothetical protein JL37_27270 [Achromobacter sp. RTa]|uniref:Zn-ribbon domain-containing OB-fold protein n=1 Tax=Achromobacter sp. RTa TaxID=1532557 RepID=UPI00050F05FA|nr:OB-fold domain-containing protein [Achromobacter sp. RTa]KGD88279.1 hypothetical protein JL37_27270 [Achromobacter sp. RTa]
MPTQNTSADPAPQARYEAYLDEGRFMLQRDRASGEHFFYPRVAAPRSGSRDLEWVAPSGLARVHATTVIHPRPPEPPYGVVLVDLDEGPRLMSRVEGMPAHEVRIGLRVRARVVQEAGRGVLVFEPVSEQA